VVVAFQVAGRVYELPESVSTILGENLRVFAAGGYREDVRLLRAGEDWIGGARAVARKHVTADRSG